MITFLINGLLGSNLQVKSASTLCAEPDLTPRTGSAHFADAP